MFEALIGVDPTIAGIAYEIADYVKQRQINDRRIVHISVRLHRNVVTLYVSLDYNMSNPVSLDVLTIRTSCPSRPFVAFFTAYGASDEWLMRFENISDPEFFEQVHHSLDEIINCESKDAILEMYGSPKARFGKDR